MHITQSTLVSEPRQDEPDNWNEVDGEKFIQIGKKNTNYLNDVDTV